MRILGCGLLVGLSLIFSCSSSSDDDDVPNVDPTPCTSDADCPLNAGCDTEKDRLNPGYCSPLCSGDDDCPTGYSCPSGIRDQPGECDGEGDHRGGKGVCDQYDGVYGPDTCG